LAKKKLTSKQIGLFIIILTVIVAWGVSKSIWFQRKLYPLAYNKEIIQHAEEFGVDPYLVVAIIFVESRFDEKAVSHRGATGLMQIMPSTGKWAAGKMKLKDYTQEDLLDSSTNIRIGCWYLMTLFKQFKDERVVLAAYNGGSGNVKKWLASKQYSSDGKKLDYIPYKETREYVDKVQKAYKKYKSIYRLETKSSTKW